MLISKSKFTIFAIDFLIIDRYTSLQFNEILNYANISAYIKFELYTFMVSTLKLTPPICRRYQRWRLCIQKTKEIIFTCVNEEDFVIIQIENIIDKIVADFSLYGLYFSQIQPNYFKNCPATCYRSESLVELAYTCGAFAH